MLKVMEKRCNECLFSKNKVVSDRRKTQLLKDIEEKDGFFICHKSTIKGEDVVCRGFYDEKTCNLIRIAQRLKAIEFVPVPDTGSVKGD